MLSTETPPAPSCPCKSSALITDETQTPNFSIRDYVFKSRNKDIAASWPFPQQFLKLCLKHGVRDVLPPFEPPDPVRGWCCRKAAVPEQPASCSRAEKISAQFESLEIKDVGPVDDETCNIRSKTWYQVDELVVGCSDQAQNPLSKKRKQRDDLADISGDETSSEGNAEAVSAVTNQDQVERASDKFSVLHCSEQVIRSVSEESLEIDVSELHPLPSKLETLHHPSEKKCRSIVKSSSITEISRTEDTLSPSSTVSDLMASKVCPVCKTFASTSNTTLNAHIDQCLSADVQIDQCLSVDNNIKRVVTKIRKPKMNPIKKRLMVDIYATAPHGTLEDLDRRNGTNWAVELALMARTSEARTEFKRPKLSPVDTRDDETPAETREDGNEGAVYVDSNGIKLRILSKFKDIPPVMPREHFKLKKHAKKMKEGKSLLRSNKKCFTSKYSKKMQVKPQTKKLSSFKSFNGEVQVAPEGDYDVNTHTEKDKPPSEMVNIPDQIRSSGSVTLRNWVCSKRSGLPKKLNHKDINNSGKSVNISKNLFVKNNQSDINNSSVAKSHIMKFSRPSEDSTYSPKTKRVDFPSNNVQIMERGKNPKSPVFNPRWSSKSTSSNGLMLEVSRSLGTPSSPSRSEEIHMRTTQKSDNSHDTTIRSPQSSHLPLKTKNSLSTKKKGLFGGPSPLKGGKDDANNKLSTAKTIRKRRSFLGTGKQGGSPSDAIGGMCHSIKHYGLDVVRTKRSMRTSLSDLSEDISRSTTEEIMDHESPCSTNISDSEDGGDTSAMKNQKYNTLKWLHHDVECNDSEMVPSDMQAELLNRKDIMTKSSMRKAVDDPVGSVPVISENLAPALCTNLDPRPSLDENMHSVCGSDAHAEPSSEKLCNEEAVTHEEAFSQNINMPDEELEGEEYTRLARYRETQAETASVQQFSACLTNYADSTLEIPQENSSITSIRRTSGQDQDLDIDREPSGSPVSTASTISPSFLPDSEFKASVASLLMRPTVQDKSSLANPCVTSLIGTGGRIVERRNCEGEAFPIATEPEKFIDGQPCCCLRNEDLSGQSQFLRQSAMTRRILPSGGKQISNLYIPASVSSSLFSYPNSRTEAMVTPILESPTESITTKTSADSASKVMTCADFSSPSPSPRTPGQSTSNSVLRLMGKNLMVANKEESAQLPLVYPAPNHNQSSAQCSPPPVFTTRNLECFPYQHHQIPGGSAVFGQAPSVIRHQQMPSYSSNMQVGGFSDSWSDGVKTIHDQQIHYNLNMERTSAAHQPRKESISSSQANMMREVIVIDDSPEFSELKSSRPSPVGVLPALPGSNLMQQRPFSCFRPESQLFPRDVTSGLRLYPNVYPRDYTNSMMQGNTSEGPNPRPPRPFLFQLPPTGHPPSFYYSQTLQ